MIESAAASRSLDRGACGLVNLLDPTQQPREFKMEKHIVVYVDTIPPCDVCGEPAYADAKSANGPWGNVCKAHFEQYGCKLGLGLGQELKLSSKRGCSCGHPDKFHC